MTHRVELPWVDWQTAEAGQRCGAMYSRGASFDSFMLASAFGAVNGIVSWGFR
jgi:hypothetical protein